MGKQAGKVGACVTTQVDRQIVVVVSSELVRASGQAAKARQLGRRVGPVFDPPVCKVESFAQPCCELH